MINVNKGWPGGHASEASYPPRAGVDISEGDFVKLVDDGAGNPVWDLATAADAAADLETGGQALDTNTFYGYDVRYSNMLPVVRKNYTAQTDRFDTAAALTVGAPLYISAVSPGRLSAAVSAGGAVVGHVEAYDAQAGVLTLSRL
jgi:hypothetical protein